MGKSARRSVLRQGRTTIGATLSREAGDTVLLKPKSGYTSAWSPSWILRGRSAESCVDSMGRNTTGVERPK